MEKVVIGSLGLHAIFKMNDTVCKIVQTSVTSTYIMTTGDLSFSEYGVLAVTKTGQFYFIPVDAKVELA